MSRRGLGCHRPCAQAAGRNQRVSVIRERERDVAVALVAALSFIVLVLVAVLMSGCGGADPEEPCEPPKAFADCMDPTESYVVCHPGDGTYWVLYTDGGRYHQTLGKTGSEPVICRST